MKKYVSHIVFGLPLLAALCCEVVMRGQVYSAKDWSSVAAIALVAAVCLLTKMYRTWSILSNHPSHPAATFAADVPYVFNEPLGLTMKLQKPVKVFSPEVEAIKQAAQDVLRDYKGANRDKKQEKG